MRATIQNREFKHPADGWYQIEAKGFHPCVCNDGQKIVQVIDDKAVNSIVNRFNQKASVRQLPHGSEMLIDHEHFQHDKNQETVAYGWAKKLRVSPDGGGFDTEKPWTATGQKAVDGGDYRFFSTEYDGPENTHFEDVPAKDIPVDIRNKYQGFRFLRPLELTGLSLTNANNNKGQNPITITNRSTLGDGQTTPHDVFPTPALDKWFAAVNAIRQTVKRNGKTTLDWDKAWKLAQQQFPEIYADAFAEIKADAPDEKSTSKQVGMLANRIRTDSGKDFAFAWNFIRDNQPQIFNRMNSRRAVVLNRQSEQPAQKKASALMLHLVQVEQAASSTSFDFAWRRVTNRRPTLSALAAGRVTLDEAFAQEPELRGQL